MKKNITINLAGHLFAIDEDAYELLNNYTETLRRYYRRQSEGEEVVDDIEARIAELLNEKLSRGYNAITIDHVQDIIQRIGNIEYLKSSYYEESNGTYSQMENDNTAHPNHLGAQGAASAAGEAVRGAWNKLRSGKRFYRDSENKMLAGVLAGCSKYFGGDLVIWRLLFLVLIFVPIPFLDELHGLTGALVIIYIILAIVAPATTTPEDILKMRGEEVNPQNLAEEVTRQTTMANANDARRQRRQTLKVITAVLLILASVWALVGFLGVLGVGSAAFFVPQFIVSSFASELEGSTTFIDVLTHSFVFLFGSIAVCLFVTGYCLMHTGLNLLDKVKSMSFKERMLWFLLWCISVICIIVSAINFGLRMSDVPSPWDDDHNASAPGMITTPDTMCVDTVEAFDPEMFDEEL